MEFYCSSHAFRKQTNKQNSLSKNSFSFIYAFYSILSRRISIFVFSYKTKYHLEQIQMSGQSVENNKKMVKQQRGSRVWVLCFIVFIVLLSSFPQHAPHLYHSSFVETMIWRKLYAYLIKYDLISNTHITSGILYWKKMLNHLILQIIVVMRTVD